MPPSNSLFQYIALGAHKSHIWHENNSSSPPLIQKADNEAETKHSRFGICYLLITFLIIRGCVLQIKTDVNKLLFNDISIRFFKSLSKFMLHWVTAYKGV